MASSVSRHDSMYEVGSLHRAGEPVRIRPREGSIDEGLCRYITMLGCDWAARAGPLDEEGG
jgi:hypothetical protein